MTTRDPRLFAGSAGISAAPLPGFGEERLMDPGTPPPGEAPGGDFQPLPPPPGPEPGPFPVDPKPPGTPPSPEPGPGPGPGSGDDAELELLLAELHGIFPWLAQLGLDNRIIRWLRQGYSGDALVGLIRQTPAWRRRFPGMLNADGSLRYANEAAYLAEEQRYRNVFSDWFPDVDTSNPAVFVAFMQNGITPESFMQRAALYHDVANAAPDIQDAFYVYSGIRPSIDELYLATVNPERREFLIRQYNVRSTLWGRDLDTWLRRVAEVGVVRTQQIFNRLIRDGLVPERFARQLQNMTVDTMENMVRRIFNASATASTEFMSLPELQQTLQFAMIGSAASSQGFELPDEARIAEYIAAGVDRARALQAYGQIATQGNEFLAFMQRANLGRFGQEDLEDALLLGEASAVDNLRRGIAFEESLGVRAGAVQVGIGRTGQFQQLGFRPVETV